MSTLPEAVTADAVQAAVTALPAVARLDGGPLGTVATYLPGRRVPGVALRPDGSCEVAVVALLSPGGSVDLVALADQVRAAVEPLTGGRVDVTVTDLATAEQPSADQPTADQPTSENSTPDHSTPSS